MNEDSHARDGITQRDRTSGAGSDGPTRRSFLTTSLAGGALVSSAGVVAGQSTETPSGPAAPTNLDTALVSGGYTVGLTWDAPADPCEGAIDRYVVTVDGSEEATVPAGVTHASVGASEGNNVFGVRAVDESGASSSTTTTGQLVYRYEPGPSVQARTSADAIAPGETASIDVRLSEATTLDHPPAFEVTVSLSASCVARITDATLAEPYRTTTVSYDPDEHASVSIADDGSSVTVAVTRSSSLRLDSSAVQPLASVEVEGESPGHVQTDVEVTSLTMADGDSIEATPWPGSLAVEATGPPAPTTLEATVPATTSGVELSWDGVGRPCGGGLSHYVVTRDGTEVATVPVGVSRARFPSEPGEVSVYEVSAVDEAGARSAAATVEAEAGASDPPQVLSVEPSRDAVAVGESVTADLVVSPGTAAVQDFTGYELTVSSSTPCAAGIESVTVPDPVELVYEPQLADDGSSVQIAADVFDGDAAGPTTLATIELGANGVGGTELSVSGVGGRDAPLLVGAIPEWSTLTVEPGEAPPAPDDVSVSQGDSASVDVSWDGAEDPCSSTVDHYVVSVDGSDERTLPAGATHTNVYTGGGDVTVGVRAVDEAGNESRTTSTSFNVVLDDPRYFFSAIAGEGSIPPGGTTTVDLSISPGPSTSGASVGEVALSVSSPCALSITDVTFGDGAPDGATAEIADDGALATLSPGGRAFTDDFASVEVTGESEGAAQILATRAAETSNADPGGTADAWTMVTVSEAAARPPAVGDNENAPADPDEDGLYEDVNGDGTTNLADAGDLFQHRNGDAVRDDVDAYDFSGNDEVDLADVVELFQENTD